ncbi:uncharacterized protein HD556DRAFT_1435292 [Suillus plorans]|uniref:Uncharacterized protein n=1 Tax=Suillus plorans TaxID=116603 RepID=A0A9P7A9K1_9AGAM|nr:uncharacterized protein HD556DRAFT_1435292 [Suillus plorans]KAG1785014.1 hypothetical protein HD556DRAFT_1435292 [Suillus plorans]
MNVFNPRINLDASIRDVTGCLSDVQKADVLLHALQHLPSEGFRIVMENAIQSFLQVSGVPPADVARALLLRAKTRLAAGYRTSAQRDLMSVLGSDPANQDVKATIQSEHLRQEMLIREPDEKLLCLPKHDLKSLLLVPHALSRIASQLIFREIDLHSTASPGTASENLSVYAVSDTSHTLAFQTGMLINSLPKLCNLRGAHCSGNSVLINHILETLCATNHHQVRNSTSTHDFISQSRDNQRSLSIKNANWKFPTDAISVRYLTVIEFEGCFSVDSQVFSEILSTGHQLQSLTLSGILECTPSAMFRLHRSSLPLHRHVTDRDLVPAISEFLRDRKHLHSFHLIVPSGDHRRIDFDASAWGVLPSLTNLRNLSPSLAVWLIPWSVRALTMDIMVPPAEDLLLFINQLRPGVPPLLTFIGMTNFPIRSVINVIDQGFSNVRLVRIEDNVWSMEQWPYRRIKYHSAVWLEFLGCEDAIWHLVCAKSEE